MPVHLRRIEVVVWGGQRERLTIYQREWNGQKLEIYLKEPFSQSANAQQTEGESEKK